MKWYTTKKRFYVSKIAFIRGLATLMIFLFHFWTFYPDFPKFFSASHLALNIFFVLSGFLLLLSLSAEQGSMKSFFVRRAKRLVPLAVFFSLVAFVLKGGGDFKNLFSHIFFIQSLSIDTYWGLNPVMWTLTLEMLFIVSLPILLIITRTRKVFFNTLLILIVLNLTYRAWIFQFFPEWSVQERIFYSEQLWGRFDQFALGSMIGILWIADWRKYLTRSVINGSIVFGLIGLSWAYFIFSELGSLFRDYIFTQVFLHFLFSLSFTLFLIGFLEKKGTCFVFSVFEKFSVYSYSFFLWHFLCLSLASKIGLLMIPALIFSFCLSLFLSFFSYWIIERNFLFKFKRR